MIALPRPDRLLVVDEYLPLGETEHGCTELQEGRILLSPTPQLRHQELLRDLCLSLRSQLPSEYTILHSIDVDLELAPAAEPGWSRRPDVVIVHKAALPRVRAERGPIRASEVLPVDIDLDRLLEEDD